MVSFAQVVQRMQPSYSMTRVVCDSQVLEELRKAMQNIADFNRIVWDEVTQTCREESDRISNSFRQRKDAQNGTLPHLADPNTGISSEDSRSQCGNDSRGMDGQSEPCTQNESLQNISVLGGQVDNTGNCNNRHKSAGITPLSTAADSASSKRLAQSRGVPASARAEDHATVGNACTAQTANNTNNSARRHGSSAQGIGSPDAIYSSACNKRSHEAASECGQNTEASGPSSKSQADLPRVGREQLLEGEV